MIIPETIGQIILLLVVAAMLTYSLPALGHSLTTSVYLMTGAIAGLLVLSVTKTLFQKFNTKVLIVLGFTLIGIATFIFFGMPSFFYEIKKLALPYWMLVSVYSLPAICIEGGLMTLFTVFFEKNADNYSKRERRLIMSCFILYAVLAFSANFLVIGDIVAIEHQLLFSRVIIAGVFLFSVTAVLRIKKII